MRSRPVTGDRAVPMSRPRVSLTQVVVILGDCGVDGDRPVNQINRGLGLVQLTYQYPEQMQRIGVIWNLVQDLAIEPLRLGPAARLVMPQGDLQRLLDRHRRHE